MAITENQYTGNGSTVLYSFTFPYLEVADIKVSLDGSLTTEYTLANATTIQFNTAPANGVAIRLYRQTDDSALPATFYSGSAIRSADLNDNFTQNLYVTQESTNNAATATTTANTALTNSNTAISTANSAVSTANTASSNASAAVSTANTASSNASAAVSTANTASTNATTAVNTANSAASDAATALSTANTALSTANTASTNATAAVSTANTASTNASSAVSTANTASSNASSAVSTANTASSNASTALSTANSALSTANAAASAVANAILYDIVANVAAIPASPANNDAVEVTDSTGIESFTPLTGIPGGFAGNSGLSVRIVYTTTGNTWTWIQYFPNDPETRYLKEAGDTMTGALGVTTGTAAAPSVFISGDPNTGIYSPGANQVAISTNGTGRLFINSIGQIGIGKIPVQLLDGEGAGNVTYRIATTDTSGSSVAQLQSRYTGGGGGTASTAIVRAGDGYVSLGASTSSPVIFISNETERLRITSAGLVGIGTSSPGYTFQVQSGFGITTDGATGETRLIAKDPNSAFYKFFTFYTQGANYAERMRIDDQGRVGIGTTSPAALLHCSQASAGVIAYYSYAGSTGGGASISVANGFSSTVPIYNFWYDNNTGLGNPAAQNLSFITGSSERARIDSSGRLLIGTSSAYAVADGTPGLQFHSTISSPLWSAISSSNWSNSTQAAGFVFAKSRGASVGTRGIVQDGDNLSRITSFGDDGTNFVTAAFIAVQVDGTPGTNDMPGRLVFSTTADGASSSTERLRISQNGVVTIQNGAVAVIDTLTDGATITPDFAAGCNFTVTLGGNRTLANPTNLTAGQSGSIFVVQDATGSRTLAFGSNWDFPGGTAPTLSTAANAVDRIDYIVRSSTSIHTVFTANYS